VSNVVKLSTSEERLDAASRWVMRMDKGLSSVEQDALRAWMAAHPKNAEVLLSMTKNWDEMDDLSRLAELFPSVSMQAQPERMWVWAAGVATVVVAMTAAALWSPLRNAINPDEPVIVAAATDTYETAIGEQSTAILSDGTVIVLNTNSRLRIVYSDQARVLRLERGEVHVEVAQDVSRPFSVLAGDRILQAVGTAFSVEITQDQRIELIVTEGRVVVGIQAAGVQPNVVPRILAQLSNNTVTAGEEIVLGAAQEVVTPVSAEEIEVKLSWREGRLIFRGELLEVALAEVERYTTVQFVFLEPDLKTRTVTGRFRAGDVDGLLVALRTNFNIVAERSQDGRVLLSSL